MSKRQPAKDIGYVAGMLRRARSRGAETVELHTDTVEWLMSLSSPVAASPQMPSAKVTVIGLPAPQGSKRHVGRGVLIESSKELKPWRDSVVWAAREQGRHVPGAVSVRMTFTLPRPKSATARAYPDRKPDVSKLVRSTEDALVDAGLIEDDARIVRLETTKVYPNCGPDALDVPGVRIEVTAL